MALLHDIQTALLDENSSVGAMLLKLRFLAAKLDTDILEEWVQHEAEGYPDGVEVPDYREAQVTYSGSFIDARQQINRVSIPTGLVAQIAGDHWVKYKIRDGLPLIEHQLKLMNPDTNFGIDCSNLKILLQGKIYEGMSIVEITSRIDTGAFARIQHAVRAKTLDFTLQLEKKVPAAAKIEVGKSAVQISANDQENVKYLTQQIFNGDVTNINSSGDNAAVTITVAKGNTSELVEALTDTGVPLLEASELAEIVKNEQPADDEDPKGSNARRWLQDKLEKGVAEAWSMGKPAAQKFITEAIKQYYGLT